ncbi:hypothetical protein ScPMuIL_005214, partial [Solemya velum]
ADCTVPVRPSWMTPSTPAGSTVSNGDTVTYTCAAGYTHISGDGISTCYLFTMSGPTISCR